MNGPSINGISWALPDDWVGWEVGDIPQATAHAAALGDDPRTTEAVVAAAREFDADVAEHMPGANLLALWTPVPGRREPLATATLRVGRAENPERMTMDELLEFARDPFYPRGTRVVDLAAVPSSVTAGEAVLRIVDKLHRFRRTVAREWTWFILPTGTTDIVALQLESWWIAHFDELTDVSTDIADAVEVTVGTT